jgi:hypothetical protein
MAQAPSGQLQDVTLNSDIAQLVRRIDRVIKEMQHAQSANVTMTLAADTERIEKYKADLNTQVDTVYGMGIPDVPETMPEQIQLRPVPEDVEVTNDDFSAVIDQFYVLRGEMVNSQSSRLGGGLLPPDHKRAKAILSRIDTMFSTFIPAVDPGDFPESTPDVSMVGHGMRGI